MNFNVHAGHNPDGKVACGATGLIQESTEARKVKERVISMLRSLGHTVYDCTVDDGDSQGDVLRKIAEKCNAQPVDLDISIHFNAGANDKNGNGRTTGTEVYVYSTTSKAHSYAKAIAASIAKLGFRNRGVKTSTGLYILKHTKSPALLIECCFVDDKDDVMLYDPDSMAQAIVRGITGKTAPLPEEQPPASKPVHPVYRVQVGAYRIRENAEAMKQKLKKAGFDAILVSQ